MIKDRLLSDKVVDERFFFQPLEVQLCTMKNLYLLLVLMCAISLLNAQTYAVGHVQVTYNDPARANRAIQTEIYYPASTAGESVPAAAGTYPVIVFGHGFVMVWSAYQNVWEALVPAGYIVAFPTTEGSFSPVHANFGADMAFLVGAIQQDGASNSSSILFGHVGSASALMGHSMGGGSAFLGAEGNANITTMVTYAAANTTPPSIAAATNIAIPSLVIAGQNDCVTPPVQHQIPMYDSLASSCKAYVEIIGGGHCYFANTNFNCSFGEGTCTPNPTISRTEQQDAATDFTLLWLNYYLKNDCSALTEFSDSLIGSQRISGTSTCVNASPIISINSNFLQSTPALSYQWLLNGAPIVGATSQTYTPTLSGFYAVVVTYPNTSCTDTSNVINWISMGTSAPTIPAFIRCFPNPANSEINVEYGNISECAEQIVITDNQGRIVKQLSMSDQNSRTGIPIGDLATGNYILMLTGENGNALARYSFSIVR